MTSAEERLDRFRARVCAQTALRRVHVAYLEFDESAHPRAENGRFGEGGGESDTQDIERWGDKAYGKEWVKGLAPAQQKALVHYQEDGHGAINGLLRSGNLDLLKSNSKWVTSDQKPIIREVDSIDKALASKPLTADTTVYRGFPLSGSPFDGMATHTLVGGEFLDHGYSSTTLDRSQADHHAANTPAGVLMTIHVPKGTNAAYLGNTRAATAGREHELLIGREAHFTVTAAHVEQARGQSILHVEVQAKHG